MDTFPIRLFWVCGGWHSISAFSYSHNTYTIYTQCTSTFRFEPFLSTPFYIHNIYQKPTISILSHIFACCRIYDTSWNFFVLSLSLPMNANSSGLSTHSTKSKAPTHANINFHTHTHTLTIYRLHTHTHTHWHRKIEKLRFSLEKYSTIARFPEIIAEIWMCIYYNDYTNVHFEWWCKIYWSSCISSLAHILAAQKIKFIYL